jgi:hypothetical protein
LAPQHTPSTLLVSQIHLRWASLSFSCSCAYITLSMYRDILRPCSFGHPGTPVGSRKNRTQHAIIVENT